MDAKKNFVNLFTDAALDRSKRPSIQIVDGYWQLIIKGDNNKRLEMVRAACVPVGSDGELEGDTLTIRWPSIADRIFGANGLMARNLPGYESRLPQIHMGRLVQRAIEMGEPAMIEAGTGTGKSFAYAAVAMAMNKRVVISTSNKALQAQLYQKDIPFLCKLFPGKKVALAQGKSNYLCRAKCQEPTPDMKDAAKKLSSARYHLDQVWQQYHDGAVSRDEVGYAEAALEVAQQAVDAEIEDCPITIENHTLATWFNETDTGNTEELEFHVHGKEQWTADEDCTGKRCPFYGRCFYYREKAKRHAADVVICNHALLILNELYPMAQILPPPDVVVVDEAHKLAEYARSALGQEFAMSSIRSAINTAFELLREQDTSPTADAEWLLEGFQSELAQVCRESKENKQVGIKSDLAFESGQNLGAALHQLADRIWRPQDTPEDTESIKLKKRADKIHTLADKLIAIASPTAPGHVRWIEQEKSEIVKLINIPFDVSEFIGKMAGFTPEAPAEVDRTACARCGRTLTASMVHVLDNKAYGPDCIRHADLLGDAELIPLAEWLATPDAEQPEPHHEPTPIIFTSATIAAPDLGHFMQECGIDHGFQMIVNSPFDYASNAMLYIPNGETPTPKSDGWAAYAVEDMRRLVQAAGGGAFLLFTSYSNMKFAVERLKGVFESDGLKVLVQNTLPKGEIAKQFKQDGNAVLFATKSFWEGISIEGAALRLVIIDKMPFAAPSPLLVARESTVSDKFGELHVPEMIIDLKQGSGRLIRRCDDWGVIALLDSRARLTGYGREKVLPSLPPAKLTHSLYEVEDFFNQKKAAPVTVPDIDFPVALNQAVYDELAELGF